MRTAQGAVLAVLLSLMAAPASAGPVFPLEVLSPAVARTGAHRVRIGVGYNEGERLPFEERERNRRVWRLPEVDLVLGIAPDIEAVVSYPFLYVRQEGQGWSFGSGDLRIGGIYRLVREGRLLPEAALHVGVKLPNADELKGFGTNQTDFVAGGLFAKRAGPWTLLVNGEFGILGNPRAATPNQDDVLLYRAGAVYSFSRRSIAALELEGVEFSRYGNDRMFLRAGVSRAWRGWVLDAGVAAGLSRGAGDYQVRAGVSYPFGVQRQEAGAPCP